MADRKLVAEIRRWDRSTPKNLKQLNGANLAEADLTGVILEEADLTEADLTGADLTGAILNRATLDRVVLRRAILNRAELRLATLIGADLGRSHLTSAKLYLANLTRTNLEGAEITGANLEGADLSGADLRHADLTSSTLRGANLKTARLDKANLNGADLQRATLTHASLTEANLLEIVSGDTLFINCDLKGAEGLTDISYTGPSSVDHRTIEKSGRFPDVFLRGCGFAEWQIEESKLLNPILTQSEITDICYEVIRLRGEQPIQLFSPFISYSHKDEPFARKLYDSLQSAGVRCWYAPEDLKIGDKIRHRIDQAIQDKDKLLLILSESSVSSEWVEKEVETAFEKERETGQVVLFPIQVDDSVMDVKAGWAADIRRRLHIGDFREWSNDMAFESGVARVLRDLQK